MIRLNRDRTAVVAGMRGQSRIDNELLLLRKAATGSPKLNSKKWKAVKAQLKAETHGKCAYCEAPTDLVAHGDVEHFRPKSVYWWLAYCYDNFLFSCQICNQTHKGNRFPVHGQALTAPQVPLGATEADLAQLAGSLAPDPFDDSAGPFLVDFEAAAEAEQAGVPNPYAFDPEPLFAWAADDNEKHVLVEARDSSPAAERALQAADDCLGINRDELARRRWSDVYQHLTSLREMLALRGMPPEAIDATQKGIAAMMTEDSAFAGMVRYFVRSEWQLDLGPHGP